MPSSARPETLSHGVPGQPEEPHPDEWLRGVWGRSGYCGENVEGPFEIAGDGGEVNLGGSFGETAPSHAAEPVTSRPRTEDLFHPAADAMDRLVPGLQTRQRRLFVVPPTNPSPPRRACRLRTGSPWRRGYRDRRLSAKT